MQSVSQSHVNNSLVSHCWDTDCAHLPDDTVGNVEISHFPI